MNKERFGDLFELVYDQNGNITSLMHPADNHKMNWVEGTTPWGSVKCNKKLSVEINREYTSRGTLKEIYEFKMKRTTIFLQTWVTSLFIPPSMMIIRRQQSV